MIRSWLPDLGLLLALAALALALRLPYYQLMPAFSDEVDEVYLAVQVAQGHALPLTNVSAYLGSLWNYLVAATFLAGGFNLHAPRTLVLVLGVLTVVVTYPLGRTWAEGWRVGGLLAAVLLATSPEHIVINSHIAWSNCVTPLFTTLGVTALWRAVSEQRVTARPVPAKRPCAGLWLILAGLWWGLAFQTHPTVLAMVPGAAAYLIWRGRPLIRTRWPYLACAMFMLVNLNLVVHDLTSGFESISEARVRSSSYTRNERLTPIVYAQRLTTLIPGLVRYLGGAVDQRQIDRPEQILVDPGLWPMSLLAVAGVLWQWRRANALPALLLISAMLIMPLFIRRIESVQAGRYLAPLLPILYASIAALFTACIRLPGLARPVQLNLPPLWPELRYGGPWLVVIFLALHPLIYLRIYYEQDPLIGGTNATFYQTMDQIEANRQDGEVVIVDRPARERTVGWGGALLSNAFQLLLVLDNVPYRLTDLDTDDLLEPGKRCRDQLVLPSRRNPDELSVITTRFALQPLPRESGASPSSQVAFPLYRLGRLPDAPSDC